MYRREDAVKWAADFLCRADKSTGLDISPILPSVMECLEHRVAEVRSGAERCLAAVIACGGLEAVNRCLRDLKPAQLKTLRPICDKAEKAAAALSIANPAGAVVKQEGASGGDSAVPPILPKAVVREHAPIEKEPSLASIGRKEGGSATSSVSGLARKVAAQAPKADHPEPSDDAEPAGDVAKALRCNGGKEAREKQHGKVKWLLDDAREAEMLLEALDRQMAPVSSEDVHAKLFSKDFKKQVDGIRDLVSFIPQNPKVIRVEIGGFLQPLTGLFAGAHGQSGPSSQNVHTSHDGQSRQYNPCTRGFGAAARRLRGRSTQHLGDGWSLYSPSPHPHPTPIVTESLFGWTGFGWKRLPAQRPRSLRLFPSVDGGGWQQQ